jgi:hypothetical protein
LDDTTDAGLTNYSRSDNERRQEVTAETRVAAAAASVDMTAEEFGHSPFPRWTPGLRSKIDP